ncbi:hypothetical protein GPECTOR_791g11 [Gonium pectorale]|uniref:Uncharacterized protein n=1 Tax=Gonium pectorale TaxID=33097 RepID=A0A150FU34_GONPE|nr:hypothetical protein GPECTOR_791g11 [Gonium pectorale]|eukprot:KXZ41106.1 hypothetical protein GPECTOR_791g11 [Gonium pectorale]
MDVYVSQASSYGMLLGADFLAPIHADIRYSKSCLEYTNDLGGRSTIPIRFMQGTPETLTLDTVCNEQPANPKVESSKKASKGPKTLMACAVAEPATCKTPEPLLPALGSDVKESPPDTPSKPAPPTDHPITQPPSPIPYGGDYSGSDDDSEASDACAAAIAAILSNAGNAPQEEQPSVPSSPIVDPYSQPLSDLMTKTD